MAQNSSGGFVFVPFTTTSTLSTASSKQSKTSQLRRMARLSSWNISFTRIGSATSLPTLTLMKELEIFFQFRALSSSHSLRPTFPGHSQVFETQVPHWTAQKFLTAVPSFHGAVTAFTPTSSSTRTFMNPNGSSRSSSRIYQEST